MPVANPSSTGAYHAGGNGGVAGFVDQDEASGTAILLVFVETQPFGSLDSHQTDIV